MTEILFGRLIRIIKKFSQTQLDWTTALAKQTISTLKEFIWVLTVFRNIFIFCVNVSLFRVLTFLSTPSIRDAKALKDEIRKL